MKPPSRIYLDMKCIPPPGIYKAYTPPGIYLPWYEAYVSPPGIYLPGHEAYTPARN